MHEYDGLVAEHRALQKQLTDEPDSLSLDRVERFIAQIREAGADIGDLQHRDQLRAILTYWGAFIRIKAKMTRA